MSDGGYHAYVGLLVFSGLLLSVLAVRGFGQATRIRVADGVFGAAFLGYAAYLIIAAPATVEIFFYAFAAPILASAHAVRSLRSRQQIPTPPEYATTSGPVPSGYAPGAFAGPTEPPPRPATSRAAYEPMPSGLAAAHPAAGHSHAESRATVEPPVPQPHVSMPHGSQPFKTQPHVSQPSGSQPSGSQPSGLSGMWAAAGSRAEHGGTTQPDGPPAGYHPSHTAAAATQRNAGQAQSSGRHRAADQAEPPPADWPPHS